MCSHYEAPLRKLLQTSYPTATYNARRETVAEKPACRDASKRPEHCIIPTEAIYEPDWRSGKAVPTRITRTDGVLLGVAGLYERRKAADGGWAFSFTMRTPNSNDHPLFNEMHWPDPKRPPELQDKRMVPLSTPINIAVRSP